MAEVGESKAYRDTITGDLGFLVKHEGKTVIRLDRPDQDIFRAFDKKNGRWVVDREARSMNPYQVAQICFEADKQLCKALGLHDKAMRDWLGLTQEQQRGWADVGPTEPTVRVMLYRGIKKAIAPMTKKK